MLLLKLNLVLEIPWSWGCIIRDIMVFLVNCLGLSELLWLCVDACAFVSFMSLTAHILIVNVGLRLHTAGYLGKGTSPVLLWTWGPCYSRFNTISLLVSLPNVSSKGRNIWNFWFLVCICNSTPKVDCHSTAERDCREISFGAASYTQLMLSSLHQIMFLRSRLKTRSCFSVFKMKTYWG